ncbi:HlyD family secretion protein [Lonepinella sp. BR2882]|uniref:HlyD family secretion protein n=1 Tax=Lonepinella sp. BR2882 TaxID=3095283 RepID=UPI003F6DDB4A
MSEQQTENTTPNPASTAQQEKAQTWQPQKHNIITRLSLVVALIIAVLMICYAYKFPPFGMLGQSTENAYVRAKTTVISPQVSGYITEVVAQDFANVKKGDVLFRIDSRSYQQNLDQAKANLAVAEANLANNTQTISSAKAAILAKQASLNSAEVSLKKAQSDWNRMSKLVASNSISQMEADSYRSATDTAKANVETAKANIAIAQEDLKKAQVNAGVLQANVESAKASVELAQISLDHTQITAPENGRLSEVSGKLGQYVTAGSQLLYLVPEKIWVIAYFREKQMADVEIGKSMAIHTDMLPENFTGKITHIAPATGNDFSLISTDTTTGNFVKTPRWFAVKIEFDAGQNKLEKLASGMSVEVRVK